MPARLEYTITGSNTGLANAASQSIGILQNLQTQADKLKIKLFSETDASKLQGIGGALTVITGRMREYTDAAIKGSAAFQDQQVKAAIDALSVKLSVLTGNAQLFGNSIKNSQDQINAYQAAINKLLSAGLNPVDSRVISLKANIDSLTSSINAQKAAAQNLTDPYAKFATTGSLIRDAENKVRNLSAALRDATDTRSIIQYNQRLQQAQSELGRLTTLGRTAATTQEVLGRAAQRASVGFNSVGLEFGRIIQDAPFAANNFGAIGNNITRLVEVLPGYSAQLRIALEAQGKTATTGALLKAGLGGLFSGFGAVIIGVSLLTTAFTFYQQRQQKIAREATDHTNILQKQKQALDDYVGSLDASARASAGAATRYAEEVTKLDILFSSLKKNADARYGTVSALEELQKSWPQEFGNLRQGEALTDSVTAAYERLRNSLKQTGIALAAQGLSADATKRLVENTVALESATQRTAEAQKNYNKQLELYNKSTSGLQSSAKALGGQDVLKRGLDQAAETLDNATTLANGFRIEVFKANKEIANFNKASEDAQKKIQTPVKSGLVYDLERQIKLLQDQQPLIKDRAALEQNINDIKAKQAELDALLGRNAKERAGIAARQLSLEQQLQNILAKGLNSSNASGLTGYALEVQKINTQYNELNRQLDQFNAKVKVQAGAGKITQSKSSSLIQTSDQGRALLQTQREKELADARITEEQRVANEVDRIRNDSGIKAELSRGKELARIQAWYDAEVVKAKSNEIILAALREGRTAQIQAVNDKYQKIEDDLWANILQINDTALATLRGRDEKETDRIQRAWEERRKAANRYFETLKLIAATDVALPGAPDAINKILKGIKIGNITADQASTNDNITAASDSDVYRAQIKDFTDGVRRGLGTLTQDFYNTFANLNQAADQSFGAVFATLVQKTTETFNQIFLNLLTKKLEESLLNSFVSAGTVAKDSLSKGIEQGVSGVGKKLGNELQLGLAAAGLLGGVVSGIAPKTSIAGQGVGGALSGAAAGATLGSVLPGLGTVAGGIIGGVVGAIGGIFGASKAKKLQEQQLEEARKQTALLRQSALAYTSSIIGRMTTRGIVTNVSIDAFGELSAKVSGKDLEFVLGRAKR